MITSNVCDTEAPRKNLDDSRLEMDAIIVSHNLLRASYLRNHMVCANACANVKWMQILKKIVGWIDKFKGNDYENNKEGYLARASKWRKNNAEKRKEIAKNWAANNPDYGAMKRRERYAKLMQAFPSWADTDYIRDVYRDCSEFNQLLRDAGISTKITVDHIVPISSDEVCGLHCEFNLDILTLEENSSKNNRHIVNQYHYGT